LSDDATQKWQAARLARQDKPANDVTTNFATIEEALVALETIRKQFRRSTVPPAPASGTHEAVSTTSGTHEAAATPPFTALRLPRV
jgi:hypothetical protein